MADATAKSVNGMVKSAAPAAAGLGIGAAIMALLQGSPQVVTEIVRWGPALLVIALAAILLDRHAGPAIGALQKSAENIGGLAIAVRATQEERHELLAERKEVIMALGVIAQTAEETKNWVKELSAKMDRTGKGQQ
jgi:hypothetical protein